MNEKSSEIFRNFAILLIRINDNVLTMKKLIFICGLVATMFFGSSAMAESQQPLVEQEEFDTSWTDTIAVIKDANRAILTQQGDKIMLTVHGSGSDKNFYYRYGMEPIVDTLEPPKEPIGIDVPFAGNFSHSSSAMQFLKNIYVGCNMPIGPGKNLKAGWEIGVAEVIGYGYTPNQGKTTFSTGFGFGYRTLSVANGLLFDRDNHTLVLAPTSEGEYKPSAYVDFWQLHFPLLITQKLGRNFGFNLGVLLNLNVSSKAHNSYKLEGERYKTTLDNLHQRFFTPDIFATVGKPGLLGVYLRYSPMNAMMHYAGTRMSTFSIGVNLNF